LRVMHFIEENKRVERQVDALRKDNLRKFLSLVNESGDSSYKYVQNSYSTQNVNEQGISLALALTEKFIKKKGEGACRIHGGGFAGTIQAFIPQKHADEYVDFIKGIFGHTSTTIISLRDTGSSRV
jgi:galactokinase